MLQFMTLSNSSNSASTGDSVDTIEDELSSWEGDEGSSIGLIPDLSEIGGTNLDRSDHQSKDDEVGSDEVDEDEKSLSQSATPFIPLLTALGFHSEDIDQVIQETSSTMKDDKHHRCS